LVGPGDQYDTLGLEALLLAAGQFALRVAVLVDLHPAQPVSGSATLTVAQIYQAASASALLLEAAAR